MRLSPAWQLIHSPSQQRNSALCWNVVKQQLFHHCSDGQKPAQNLPPSFFCLNIYWLLSITDAVSWVEVQRLFHLSVFESLVLTELDLEEESDKERDLLKSVEPTQQKEPHITIPWDDPLAFAREQLRKQHAEGLLPWWFYSVTATSSYKHQTTSFYLCWSQPRLFSPTTPTPLRYCFVYYLHD